MPFLGWRQPQFVEQALEAVAVLGEIDGVGRGAEDRHLARISSGPASLRRRLAAELHDHAMQRAVCGVSAAMISSTSLGGEGLENRAGRTYRSPVENRFPDCNSP